MILKLADKKRLLMGRKHGKEFHSSINRQRPLVNKRLQTTVVHKTTSKQPANGILSPLQTQTEVIYKWQ